MNYLCKNGLYKSKDVRVKELIGEYELYMREWIIQIKRRQSDGINSSDEF